MGWGAWWVVHSRRVEILLFAFSLAAPFVEMVREMLEMRYLWEADLLLENAKLVAALGEEPHTPLDLALRTTLMGQGCLGPALVKAA